MHAEQLVVGIDAGGTSTRAWLMDGEGSLLKTGNAAGSNPVGVGFRVAVQNIAAALESACAGIDTTRLRAVCAGIAGVKSLSAPDYEELGRLIRARLNLTCNVEMVGDSTIAFAAATDETDGAVLIAGTGASAFAIHDREPGQRSDGYGWLLGDLGSGFWLGQQAVRATLRYLDGHVPNGSMVEQVIDTFMGETVQASPSAAHLIGQCMAQSPRSLARLAPIVCEAAADDDETAQEIINEAVNHLAATVKAVAQPGKPVALAGSLLTNNTPIASGLTCHLSRELPASPLYQAVHPVAGAAWLALKHIEPDAHRQRKLHRVVGLAQP
ncbi:N-acetylglucosamine kinase [Natronoglycomyces albus]|uniref:N-acetylglucosamine kinase n=1 Tax=Natronoglycomyces albus TaxID=2811108 RepID=A0A895XHF7_9ACTN|nr:BadF/BadG/BcrA/BcrD ATPase family protein [Natronoglycomyces albus]QSB04367.1 N-acetylglucosamine kinase [Natronoglycomyces albus]